MPYSLPSALPQWSLSWSPRYWQNPGQVTRILFGKHVPRCQEVPSWMCRMPASQTAIAKQGTAHFHAYWEAMADGSCQCFDSSIISERQPLPTSSPRLLYQMGRCIPLADQTAFAIIAALIKFFLHWGCLTKSIRIKDIILKAPYSNSV